MTIGLNVGSQSMQAVPKEASWVSGLQGCNAASFGDLDSFKLQYTSLRDLIVVSPTKCGSPNANDLEWCDLSQVNFKDELLKQAARAYLQPSGKTTTPEVNLLERCWKSFTAKNKAVVTNVKEYVRSQAEACALFLKARAIGLVQRLKLQYLGFLRVRPRSRNKPHQNVSGSYQE